MNMKWRGALLLAALVVSRSVMASTNATVDLQTCLRTAMASNPDLRATTRRIEAARAAMGQAQSAWYPQVKASANYARTDNPPQAFFMQLNQRQASMQKDFNHPDDTENWRLSAGAQWLLFDGGARELGIDMAGKGVQAREAAHEAARNELIYQITRAYYGVLQAEAFVKVQEEAVASIGESLRVARRRFESGAAVKIDVLNLEVELAANREALIRAQNGARLARAGLNAAIGTELVCEATLIAPAEKAPEPPTGVTPEQAVDARPEYRAARLAAEIAEKGFRKQGRAYLPQVSAFGSYDWDSAAIDGDYEGSYMAGAMVSVDVFTGFRRGKARAQAMAEWEAAKDGVAAARNNLRLDWMQANLSARDAYERMGVARKSLESADEALRITRQQYEKGSADITMLLTAQVGLTATQTRYVAARYEYLTALANVARARGEPGAETDGSNF